MPESGMIADLASKRRDTQLAGIRRDRLSPPESGGTVSSPNSGMIADQRRDRWDLPHAPE